MTNWPTARLEVADHYYGLKCGNCGQKFRQNGDGTMIHPTHHGFLSQRPIICPYIGRRFVNPMETMRLTEVFKTDASPRPK